MGGDAETPARFNGRRAVLMFCTARKRLTWLRILVSQRGGEAAAVAQG